MQDFVGFFLNILLVFFVNPLNCFRFTINSIFCHHFKKAGALVDRFCALSQKQYASVQFPFDSKAKKA